MLARVAYICGGTQYQFERVSSQQVLFNVCLVIFHACSFHDTVHDMRITRYEEAWSTQARNGDALWISRGTTHGHACNSEVVIEQYHICYILVIKPALPYPIEQNSGKENLDDSVGDV